jgi:aryl-alcohol dehydrogenase-like predicted oxidoreductase
MRYKLLGRSGLRVSELCLGTMTFGNTTWGTPEPEALRMYGRFRDAGGNFIDTANEIYAGGRSEEILGRLCAGHRDELVLASKFGFGMPGGRNPNSAGNHRKSLMRSLDSSLARLGTDYLDIMWVHAWDGVTPADELMRALDDVVRQSKVQYVGISNTPAWVVAQANTLAECRGWTSFMGLQVEYNLTERSAEHELLPMAGRLGLSVAAWSPLASGILSGKYAASNGTGGDDARRLDTMKLKTLTPRHLAIAEGVSEVARQHDCSAVHVALNWLRARADVIPILGARTDEQLAANLGCLAHRLDADALRALDALSAPQSMYPHDYLQQVRAPLNAGFQEMIDGRPF